LSVVSQSVMPCLEFWITHDKYGLWTNGGANEQKFSISTYIREMASKKARPKPKENLVYVSLETDRNDLHVLQYMMN